MEVIYTWFHGKKRRKSKYFAEGFCIYNSEQYLHVLIVEISNNLSWKRYQQWEWEVMYGIGFSTGTANARE